MDKKGLLDDGAPGNDGQLGVTLEGTTGTVKGLGSARLSGFFGEMYCGGKQAMTMDTATQGLTIVV